MPEFEASKIRNFAIVGHGSSGKTILAESMLACSGVINRLGTIVDGNTVSDYHEDEQQHQISIHTTPMFAEWNSCKLNILDAPGYADFIGETLSALRVTDFVVLTVHGAHGIELGTEQTWDRITENGIPSIEISTLESSLRMASDLPASKGEGACSEMKSSSCGTPVDAADAAAKTGIKVCCWNAPLSPSFISVELSSPSSKNFSSNLSSDSATFSISC